MECTIESVLLNPEQRSEHIKRLLELDGLVISEEMVDGIYTALPLTGATDEMKIFIEKEHEKIKECINDSGLRIYDPKDAADNPWRSLKSEPTYVYDVDTIQVVTPRFFEFTNVFPSTGAGVEEQKAITYIKIPVVITKSGIRTSRMSTGARRIILIEYEDAVAQRNEIASVFKTLRAYEPGIGNCSIHGNTLLGFAGNDEPICLPGLIGDKFPSLVYNFEKYKTS